MPKLTDREKLVELEDRRAKVVSEIEATRKVVRSRYAEAVSDVAVERLSEREFRELLSHAVRAGGAASIAALKALPAAS